MGHCLLHDLGNLCQKGICTVDRLKYVYEEATMATVWCNPGPSTEGIVLFLFIYLLSTSHLLNAINMQKKGVGAQLICSHTTDIMQEIRFSPVMFYIHSVFRIICVKVCNMLSCRPQYLPQYTEFPYQG